MAQTDALDLAPTSAKRLLGGPLVTLAVVAATVLLTHRAFSFPGLGIVLLATVIYAVLVGGKASGWVSAVTAVGFYAYASRTPGAPALHYARANLERLLIVMAVTPILVTTLGALRTKLDRYLVRERALRAEAEAERRRVLGILESISDGFFALDREWRLVYMNSAAERIVGRPREDVLGRVLWEEFPRLVGTAWEREYHRAVEQQSAVHVEEHLEPLGRWFETNGYPTPDGLSVYFRDVTVRRRAQDAARRRARQQAAVAALGERALREPELRPLLDAAVRTIADILDVELAKVLELAPDGRDLLLVAGVGWHEGVVGHARVHAAERSQAGYTLLCSGPVVVEDLRSETRFEGPSLLEEHGVVSGMSVVIPGGDRPFGILGAHTRQNRSFDPEDVDALRGVANVVAAAIARTRSDQARADTELQLRQLAENVHEVFFVLDAATKDLLYVSPAYERVWGRTGQSLHESPRSWREAIHPEDRARAEACLLAIDQGREYAVDYRIIRPDGEVRWIRDRAFPVRSASGDTRRIVGVAEDITARLASEDDARRLAAAEAAVRARDEVVAVVSHDLRSPLGTLLMSLALLEKEHPDASGARPFEIIRRSVQRMARLIDDLLDVSTIEAGRFAVELRELELGALVREACENVAPEVERKALQLVCDVPCELPVVAGDRGRLLQVLANLIGNAVKFTPEGGRITVSAEVAERDVRVSVEDTGPGILREHLPHVFDRFWQARTSDRRGVGLGLAIAKGIVEAHGGAIAVESGAGRTGATFRFTVPLVREGESAGPTAACR